MRNRRTVGRVAAGLTALTMLAATGCAATVNQPAAAPSTPAPAASTPASAGPGTGSAPASSATDGASTSGAPSGAPGGMLPVEGTCSEPVDIAMNAWVGYTANAAVVTEVLESKLGCKVNQTELKEDISWQGFASGKVDVIIENWGHPDLIKKYVDTDKTAEMAGLTGNVGVIGWYVPPWLAAEHPDILQWENLNKYAENFKTSESGDQGQLLDGDPTFVTNDEALVTNLDLDFKVIYAGSEAALIEAFKDAEANKKWLLGYFYSPQWFLSEVPLEKVSLPAWTEGCDADPKKVACDYPEMELDKVISTAFAASGSPAVNLIKNFNWTNEDQNLVAKYITADGMSPADAAKKWVTDNEAKVNAWLGK